MNAASSVPQQHLKAILFRSGAIICLTLMSAAMKKASEDGATVLEMLFARGVIGVPLVLASLALRGQLGQLRTDRPRAHLFRAFIGVTSILLIFQGLILLPIAESVTIGFSAPIFATLLSIALLSEKVGGYRLAAVAIGFVGVIVVAQPGGGEALVTAGIVFALLGAASNGLATVTIRSMGASERPIAITFSFLLFALVVGGIGMIFVATPHRPETYAMLAFGGGIGTLGQFMISKSLHMAPVAVVVPFDYSQIIWAALLGWLIWSTVPGVNTVLGGALIVASGLFTAWREHRLHRQDAGGPVPVE